MKRLILICLFAVLSAFAVHAQDLIAKLNGEVIECRITHSDKKKIRYTLKGDPLRIYTLMKSEIKMVKYGSGKIEQISDDKLVIAEHSPKVGSSSAPVKNIIPYMKYSELKQIYDYRQYRYSAHDRYSRGWIGVASFIIPGMGECLCGESSRGVWKFVSNLALASIGTTILLNAPTTAGAAVSLVCYSGCLAIDIWSIVDAVRIAKVKNMYEHDLREKYFLELFPSANYTYVGSTVHPTAGLTLALRF